MSVFYRDTSVVCDVTANFSEQLLRHGITLVPAISFAINKSSFVSLYDEYNASIDEAKKLRSAIGIDSTSRSKRRIRASSFVASSYREHPLVRKTIHVVSPLFILTGLLLGTYVTGKFYTQLYDCEVSVGPIARCMSPQFYFSNGFFGTTGCSFQNVTTIHCQHHQLPRVILEAPVIYATMQRLHSINISSNPTLEKIPWSWGLIPNLHTIDTRGTSLINIPYHICAGESILSLNNIHVDASFSTLNWTGEILRFRHFTKMNHSTIVLANGCQSLFTYQLQNLLLASNQLTCPSKYTAEAIRHKPKDIHTTLQDPELIVSDSSEECDFVAVESAKKLQFLDLSNNSISTIRIHLHKLTEKNQLGNASARGVILRGNPIQLIDFNAMVPENAKAWMRFMQSFFADSTSIVTRLTARLISLTSVKNFADCTKKAGNLMSCPLIQNLGLGYPFFQKLEYLVLNHNYLTSVDSVFQNLTNLRYLGIEDNDISTITVDTFRGLHNLEKLDFDKNQISKFEPGCFVDLVKMWGLGLEYAAVRVLERGIFKNLPKLRKLDMRYGLLQTLKPGCFENMTNLRDIDLKENKIEILESELFPPLSLLPTMSWMNLGKNNIKRIGAHAFVGLSNLGELHLNDNFIPSLNSSMFVGLHRLTYLTLDNNKLDILRNDTFTEVPSLTKLDISSNNIVKIEKGTFLGLPMLKCVDLSGNPIANQTNHLLFSKDADVHICYDSCNLDKC